MQHINSNGISFTTTNHEESIIVSASLTKEQYAEVLPNLTYISTCGEAVFLSSNESIEFYTNKVFSDKFELRSSDTTDKTVIKFQKKDDEFVVTTDTILPTENKKVKTPISGTIKIEDVIEFSLSSSVKLMKNKIFERALIDWTKGDKEKKESADLKKKIDKLQKSISKYYLVLDDVLQTSSSTYEIVYDKKVIGKVEVKNGVSSIYEKKPDLNFEKLSETFPEGLDKFLPGERDYHLDIAKDTIFRSAGILVD